MAVEKVSVAGVDPATREDKEPKAKDIDVEVDGRDVVVSINTTSVALSRHVVPALVQALQRGFMEVS